MAWNYRVMRRVHPNGEVTLGLHEVYYDDGGQPQSWSHDPDDPHGETLDELRDDLRRMTDALAKPILDYATGRPIA